MPTGHSRTTGAIDTPVEVMPAAVPFPATATELHPTEDVLALYRTIFANSTEAIAVISPTGEYLEQNLAHEALLGYSPQELRGLTPAVHMGQETFASVAAELAAEGQCRREITSIAKSGRTLRIELSAFAVRGASGAPVCYVGIKRDITERTRAAQQLERRFEQMQALYRLVDAVSRSVALEEIYELALTGLERALGAERTSVLLFDPDDVMRFKAWHGLSDAYRAAVEGHSPWSRRALHPEPIFIADAEADPSLAPFLPAFRAEGIRALGFVPLVYDGELLGKFMLYFGGVHRVEDDEVQLAHAIARHIAIAIARTRSALALRESEERYRQLVEVCPVGVAVHAGGPLLFVNLAGAHLLGAEDPASIIGRPVFDFIDPSFHDRVRERNRLLLEGARDVPPLEERFVRLDGHAIQVEAAATAFRFEGRPAVQLVFRDITDRTRAAEAQRLLAETGEVLASSLEYETTLQAVSQLAVPALAEWCFVDLVRDEDSYVRVAVAHADAAAAPLAVALQRRYPLGTDAVHGVSRAVRTGQTELVTRADQDAVAELVPGEEQQELARRLALHAFICVPLLARGRTLGVMTFAASDAARRYDARDVALAEELARRAALAVDNARLYREANEANRSKSRFLAVMSHELRTPLNAIAGYTELLEMGVHGELHGAQLEDVRRIQANQRHLLRLISDVLDFAKLETGHLELDIADVSVEETLAGMRVLIEPQLLAKGIRYVQDHGDPRVTCRADGEKMQQVVLNLLSNAVKYTERGGTIGLSWQQRDGGVHIDVRDTGHGIPPDKLETVFEPFIQLSDGYAARREGTGLGLAISRELARAMGGDISVRSRVGEGSTFTIRLSSS